MISLTANAFAEAQEETIAAGFQDFISKPFQQEDLLAKIAQHLSIDYTDEDDGATSEGV
jgi:CheY-like chemotaxis protein